MGLVVAGLWAWSGWRYLWVGSGRYGLLVDEGCVYLLVMEEHQHAVVRVVLEEVWRRELLPSPPPLLPGSTIETWRQAQYSARVPGPRWRRWGMTKEIAAFDGLFGSTFVRATVPLWMIALGAVGGGIACVRWPRRVGVGRCGACGYDLRGLVKGTLCPECGKGAACV